MGWAGVGSGEVGEEVDAVEFPVGVDLGFCGGECGGQEVELDDGLVVDLAGGEFAFPVEDEGDVDTAFEGGSFGASEWLIGRPVDGGSAHGGAAVIADEEDEGVIVEVGGFEGVEDLADVFVHGREHGGVGTSGFVGDAGEAFESGVGGVHRGMNSVEGDFEEEGLIFVLVDEGDGFSADGVGEVGGFLDDLGASEDVAGVLGEVGMGASEEAEEFVEAAFQGVKFGVGAEVPLADEAGGVAGGFESVGEGFFGEGEAEVG